MPKPFQFSMQRMFLAVAFLCIAAASFSDYWRKCTDGQMDLGFSLFLVVFASAGAGLGALFGRPFRGLLIGLGLIFFLWLSQVGFPGIVRAWLEWC